MGIEANIVQSVAHVHTDIEIGRTLAHHLHVLGALTLGVTHIVLQLDTRNLRTSIRERNLHHIILDLEGLICALQCCVQIITQICIQSLIGTLLTLLSRQSISCD